MGMGFRRSPFKFKSAGGGSPYLPQSNLFFAAAPITDTSQKNAIDTAYRALVAAGQYSLLLRWYPCAGASLSASLMDFVTLTRATSVLTFSDPLFYDIGTGWYFTGTQYITTGFTPSTNGGSLWTDDTGYLAADVNQLDNSGTFVGATGLGKASYVRHDGGLSGVVGAINVDGVGSYQNCGFFAGIYSILRYQTSIAHLFYNSFEVLEDTTAPALAPSNRELWIGAMNDAGGVTDLFGGSICGARMGGQVDPSLIDPIISTMNTAFGRSLF
jgi:hypothetical protein